MAADGRGATPEVAVPSVPMDRRRFLISAVGTAGIAGLTVVGCTSSRSSGSEGSASTDTATTVDAGQVPATAPAAGACTLTPEMTSGPYYIDAMAIRRDITEDRQGFPLDLTFTVIDSSTCEPLAAAAVDIWHCDANGEYSGWNGNTLAETFANGRNTKTYLRGIQLTDTDGRARFRTIYPGWYEGRAIHVHLEVHTGGRAGTTYQGGHVNHIGQVFFDDGLSDELMKRGPYATHTGTRTRNDQDTIYAKGGDNQIVRVDPSTASSPEAGFRGSVTLAVDPHAVPVPLPVA